MATRRISKRRNVDVAAACKREEAQQRRAMYREGQKMLDNRAWERKERSPRELRIEPAFRASDLRITKEPLGKLTATKVGQLRATRDGLPPRDERPKSLLDMVFKGKHLRDMTGAEVRALVRKCRALASAEQAKAYERRMRQACELLTAAGYRVDAKGNWHLPRRRG